MQVQLDIGFDQLVQLAKRLPAPQWTKLKKEVDKEKEESSQVTDIEAFLLTAPTFTERQFEEITKTRKAISQWRTK